MAIKNLFQSFRNGTELRDPFSQCLNSYWLFVIIESKLGLVNNVSSLLGTCNSLVLWPNSLSSTSLAEN